MIAFINILDVGQRIYYLEKNAGTYFVHPADVVSVGKEKVCVVDGWNGIHFFSWREIFADEQDAQNEIRNLQDDID